MIYIFLGPPGCGKGTQAKILADRLSVKSFSAGDLLRHEIEIKSDIGLEVKGIIQKGDLVTDDLIAKLVQKNAEPHTSNDIIIDGYPRSMGQAALLMEWIEKSNQDVKVIFFDIPKEELLDRVINRITCASCGVMYNLKTNKPKKIGVCDKCGGTDFKRRKDDDPETFKKRLITNEKESTQIIAFFEDRGLLCKIDAEKGMSIVTEQILSIMQKESHGTY